jgi:hypothetical protein
MKPYQPNEIVEKISLAVLNAKSAAGANDSADRGEPADRSEPQKRSLG